MRKCPSCKTLKPDAEWMNPLNHLERREGVVFCTPCTRDKGWIDQFPIGTDCVYLIKGGDLRKIGYSNNLGRRLASLRTISPVPLVLEYVWPGTRDNELALHRHFKKRRHHGEWFDLSDGAVAGFIGKDLPVVQKMSPTSMRTSRTARVTGSRHAAIWK